ncbi:hypothetical protein KIPE111705_17070 [Kibdelosporangium persicum]|uniref:hypothetical protein n=1 Tax=Kibdelosporangium persicum TaxID=2698649 RepID=UPI001563A521|nr:hypothetical protein [Kibdelosporangium persicum]
MASWKHVSAHRLVAAEHLGERSFGGKDLQDMDGLYVMSLDGAVVHGCAGP